MRLAHAALAVREEAVLGPERRLAPPGDDRVEVRRAPENTDGFERAAVAVAPRRRRLAREPKKQRLKWCAISS